MTNISLGDLIEWLEQHDEDMVIKDGFGEPHSYRGNYTELAFEPLPEARIGDMLAHARSALGETFQGYKGGSFIMYPFTPCNIAEYGECGEAITHTHFKYWLLTAA